LSELVGIAGTNGKSSTKSLAEKILEYGGVSAERVEVIELHDQDLANYSDCAFEVAVVLNIGDGDDAKYAAVYNNTKRVAIFNASDALTDRLVQSAEVQEGARAVGFSHRSPMRSQIGMVEGILVDRAFYADNSDPLRYLQATEIAALNEYSNLLAPNQKLANYVVQNVAAAVAIGRAYDVPIDAIRRALHDFEFSPSSNKCIYQRQLRFEDGFTPTSIYYVDNSDAHNLAASRAVTGTFSDNQLIWVVSGQAVLDNMRSQLDAILPKVYATIIIGDSTSPLYQAIRELNPTIPVELVSKYEEHDLGQRLVVVADKLALSDQFVLFSPADDVQLSDNCADLPTQIRDQLNALAEIRYAHAERVGWL
jgi:UDP-N-acetylmuramoylalanine--D-glutamate ligase